VARRKVIDRSSVWHRDKHPLTQKQLDLACTLADSDLKRHLIEDALENCVSAFDGFGRQTCQIRAQKSVDPL
jgi:hypothetical protein